MNQLSTEQIKEGYSNALVLRETANEQVKYWERLLQSVPGQPVKSKKVDSAVKLAEFNANLISGHRKPNRIKRNKPQ